MLWVGSLAENLLSVQIFGQQLALVGRRGAVKRYYLLVAERRLRDWAVAGRGRSKQGKLVTSSPKQLLLPPLSHPGHGASTKLASGTARLASCFPTPARVHHTSANLEGHPPSGRKCRHHALHVLQQQDGGLAVAQRKSTVLSTEAQESS